MTELPAAGRPDNIVFHDGTIRRVSISFSDQLCEMELHLGDWISGQPKAESVFSCTKADSFFGRFDYVELASQADPGNIQDGRLSETGDRLMLYLVGGLVEVAGGEIGLHTRPHECGRQKQSRTVKTRASGLKELDNATLDCSVLDSIDFCPEKNACHLALFVPKGECFSERVPVRLSFGGVVSCIAKFDLARMSEDTRWGNVRNCVVDVKRRTVRFYLPNGFLEVVARPAFIDRS